MERVSIFIDGSNLYKSFEKLYGHGNFNLEKLGKILCSPKRTLVEIRYYVGLLKLQDNKQLYSDQQRFINYWRNHPLCRLRLGRVVKSSGIWREKGVDVLLATDLLLTALDDKYDTAIVVSADADFIPVIEVIQVRWKKKIENAMPPEFKGKALSRACNKFIPIDKKTFEAIEMHLK